MENKSIQIQIISEENDRVKFKITKQTHICDEFGDNKNQVEIELSNKEKFILRSVNGPQFVNPNFLYVRGSEPEYNDNMLICNPNTYKNIKEAIQRYNQYYGPKLIEINEDGSFKNIK